MIVSQVRTADRTWPADVWLAVEQDIADLAWTVFDPKRTEWIVLVSPSFGQVTVDIVRLHSYLSGRARIVVIDPSVPIGVLREKLDPIAAWAGSVRLLAPEARRSDPFQRHPLIHRDIAARWVSFVTVLDRFLGPTVATDERGLRQKVHRLVAAAAAKDETISALRQEVQKLTKQLRSVVPDDPAPVWSDPEQQLRYEVGEAWLRQVAECDRESYPLPDRWLVGVDLLDSMAALEIVDRSLVVAAFVDVLCGRAAEITGRKVHYLRSNDGGDSGPVIRSDGAVGWRCAIKLNTPSAPRLMWWRHEDGTVELAFVGVHDNFRIR